MILSHWKESQRDGKQYKYLLIQKGTKAAEENMRKANEMLERRAKAAHVDLQGNHLPAPYPPEDFDPYSSSTMTEGRLRVTTSIRHT